MNAYTILQIADYLIILEPIKRSADFVCLKLSSIIHDDKKTVEHFFTLHKLVTENCECMTQSLPFLHEKINKSID